MTTFGWLTPGDADGPARRSTVAFGKLPASADRKETD
jgi:hypothetical protein